MAWRAAVCFLFTLHASASVWRYDVRETSPGHLQVEATIPGGRLHIVHGMEAFVADVRSGDAPLARSGEEWTCADPCHAQWSFDLIKAAAAMHDIDFASDMGDAILAPPGSWLLRPHDDPDRVRLHVTTIAPRKFVSGMRRIDADSYESDDFPLDVYSGFGAFDVTTIESSVEVAVMKNGGSIDPALLRTWITNAKHAIDCYYGRFPLPHVLLLVRLTPGRSGIRGGTAIGGGGASISIGLGDRTTAEDFSYDWQLTHEFTHMTFPSVPRVHHWIEEGLATYVEPIARAQAGLVPAARLWGDLADGLPKGEPQAGDEGLDRTHTWGRTYWGGALFCFVADVEIHKATKNRFGLQDALRAIMKEGGTIDKEWELTRALEIGDRATGTHVLTTLYRAMATSPHPIDLDAMFRKLGVVVTSSGAIELHDDAADAAVRRAIERTAKP